MKYVYMCPFCVSSQVCHGPHIEEKDLNKFIYRFILLQEDLAEYAKELVLEHGDNMDKETLADMLEEKLLKRQTFQFGDK